MSKNIIASRYNRATADAVTPGALETRIANNGQLAFDDPAISSASGRPIVVLGDIGVGKTSFFENLFQSLDASEKTNTYFIHINLGVKANLSDSIKAHVVTEIPAVLKRQYSLDIETAAFADAIYHQDLLDFDQSVRGKLKSIDPPAYEREKVNFLLEKIANRDRHLQASLGHLVHGRGKEVILVLDNADQRTFQVQQETFLIAQELAASRNLLVFVSLRPSTFYISKTTGALSAYQTRVLTIAPPPADDVIQRRLIFAARVAEGTVEPAALSGIRLHLESVVHFIKATLRAVRSNESIRQFLSNITGGNTRAVIELITGFFGSPNVESRKIVEIEEKTQNYKIPLHEFTKHALLGEYAYFNALSSYVACNIYDVSSGDPREHFLASLIVAFLGSNSGLLDHDGFLSGRELLNEIGRHGFTHDQLRSGLRRLATKRLIETPHGHYREIEVRDEEPPEQFHFRATSIGLYHVRYWTGSFAFLDAVSTDTPIFDEAARAEVCRRAASFDISERFKKAQTFRAYLETRWHDAGFACDYYDFISLLQFQNHTFDSVSRVRLGRNGNG